MCGFFRKARKTVGPFVAMIIVYFRKTGKNLFGEKIKDCGFFLGKPKNHLMDEQRNAVVF